MSTATAATEFRTAYRDHFNACLPQQRVRISVAVVGNHDARLEGHDIVAVIPLFAFGFVGIAARGDGAQLIESKRVPHHIEHWRFIQTNLKTAVIASRMHVVASDLTDDIGEDRHKIAVAEAEHSVEMHGRPALRHETADHSSSRLCS